MRLSKTILLGLVMACLSATQAAAQLDLPPPVAVPPLPPGALVRTISFSRMISVVDKDKTWGFIHAPLGRREPLKGSPGQFETKTGPYAIIFYDEMKRAGFQVEGDPRNMFEAPTSTSEFGIAAKVTDMEGNFRWKAGRGHRPEGVNGDAIVDIDWQVYSFLDKRIVAQVHTRGGARIEAIAENNVSATINAAFADSVRRLAASPDFRRILIGSSIPHVASTDASPRLTPITLTGPTTDLRRPMSDVVKSVAVVFAGEGHGSGFLVSADGLLLTDQHVVGIAKYVKVRWSDGTEVLGEVIRSDRIRDVALVKADAGARRPLRLRATPMQSGETVFAIGAPLDQEFQGTVTRGVVSANRTIAGLTYLQSDVTVNPGNSGGPLVDEQGAAVGLTESGMRPDGAPSGVNLFTPIKDALAALAIDVR